MQSSSNGAGSLVSLIVLIAIMVLVRRGRMNAAKVDLAKGERLRPLAITLLDPVVSLIIIGPIFWHLASTNVGHVIVAMVGAAAGLAIAWARARVMFVRALHDSRSVILRRSGAEYALLGLLIVLRFIEDPVTHDRASVASLILTALSALAVFEPIMRSAFIVMKYRQRDPVNPSLPTEMS